MAGSRSRAGPGRAGALAVLAALALAACPTRDLEPRPFRLDARLEGGGALADGFPGPEVVSLSGTARLVDATTLALSGTARGTVTLTFDRSAAPDLAFPAQLDGAAVDAEIFVDPAGTGPWSEPLPIPGYRISQAGQYQFALGEWTVAEQAGGPAVPPSLSLFQTQPDLPALSVAEEWNDWEPARCGLVYLTPLFALDGDARVALDRGERRAFYVGTTPAPVTVLHVLSYHRRGGCAGQSGTWSQIAAWRGDAVQR